MQEEEEQKSTSIVMQYAILKYPYYILAAIYYLTIHQIILIFAWLYGMIRRRIQNSQIKKITPSAKKAFEDDQYDEAIKLFLQIVDKIPEVERPLYRECQYAVLSLGSLFQITGNLEKAEKYLREADLLLAEDDLNRIFLSVYLGDFYAEKGQLKEAEKNYLSAYEWLSMDKKSDLYKTLCYSMHSLYIQMGQIHQAEKYLQES